MWWMSLLSAAQRGGQERRERERDAIRRQAPTSQDTTGLGGGINSAAAFDGDVQDDVNASRQRRRAAFGSIGKTMLSRYLGSGGQ